MKDYTRNEKNYEKRVQNAMNKRIKSEKSHQPISGLYNFIDYVLTIFKINFIISIKRKEKKVDKSTSLLKQEAFLLCGYFLPL